MAEAGQIGYGCMRLETVAPVMTKPLSCAGISAASRFDLVV
jgi:hypothetical protein